MNMTVGKLAKKYGVSRTALLYYEKTGLLTPVQRTEKGYRLYNVESERQLERVLTLRAAGLSLEQVKVMLTVRQTETASLLLRRLGELNVEIARLRQCQLALVMLLGDSELLALLNSADPTSLRKTLCQAGILSDADLSVQEQTQQWHRDFENTSPEIHHKLLTLMGLGENDVLVSSN